MTLLLTVLTGLLYPGLVTAICQALFPAQANGSLIARKGKVVGSTLIGQNFTKPEYFHPRPSAAGNDGYDGAASGGSNLGPTSQKLIDRVKASIQKLPAEDKIAPDLPSDMVTTSASGLDPHITPANAQLQSQRVAAARAITPQHLADLVQKFTEDRDLGLLGEPRVNVLRLNLALDEIYPLKK
jgi:K+-transporting ATPase ATPase C chain